MRYDYPITVPRNTPESAPLTKEYKVISGILTYVSVFFPPGCAGNVRVRIFYQDWQLGPVNRDGYLLGDANLVQWAEFIPVEVEPLVFRVHAWNLDINYDHSIMVSWVILPRAVVLPEETMAEALEEFQEQLARVFWSPPPTE